MLYNQSMVRFIHAADLHLDSPLRGLERYEGAPVERIRGATRSALVQLVDLAIREQVDFVVVAGDIYDGNWRDFGTGLFFVKQMARLRVAEIAVFMISGNHDAANKMTRSLHLPENVHRFESDSPSTVVLESHGIAIHGQSFANQAVLEDLSKQYPPAVPSLFNIGILHTCCTGREGHDRYAPCTLEGLRERGYDYWALGHIHQRETLSESPYIGFSGNIQGRHARETGAKGCNLVDIDSDRTVSVRFEPLDVVRWEQLRIDIRTAESLPDILEEVSKQLKSSLAAAEGRLLCVRVLLIGPTLLHDELLARPTQIVQEIRALSLDIAPDALWIEKVQVDTQPMGDRVPSPALSEDALAGIMSIFDGLLRSEISFDDIGFDLADAVRKLPPDLLPEDVTEGAVNRTAVVQQARTRLLNLLRRDQVTS